VLKRLFLILFLTLLAWMAWEWLTFPDVELLKNAPPKTTAFMELRRDQLRDAGKSDALEWRWVAYGRISPNLRRAVLVAEDDSFYEHEGVDLKGMREALERDWKRKKLTHGGSTITQQLAKNLYLSPSRNPIRKLREYFIARSLEKHLTKKRILEIYLNVVEMGERVYGAEAAARHYFGKSASDLSAREAALLAGCLPNPRLMNPGNPNKRLRFRQRMILSRLHRWGSVAEQEVLTEKKPEAESTTTTDTAATDTDATAPVTDTDMPPTDTAATNSDTTLEEPPVPGTIEPTATGTTSTETSPPPTNTNT
jgi:monofunctional biosynthetic peptidoglycan transglycosylase